MTRSFFHPMIAGGTDTGPTPVHFRAWTTLGPYNLCATSRAETSRWSPYRGVVTCDLCISKLKGAEQ